MHDLCMIHAYAKQHMHADLGEGSKPSPGSEGRANASDSFQ